MSEYKLCIGCNQSSTKRNRIGSWHHVSEFHTNKQNADGLAGNCKYCRTRVVVASFRRKRLLEKRERAIYHFSSEKRKIQLVKNVKCSPLLYLNAMSRKLHNNSNKGLHMSDQNPVDRFYNLVAPITPEVRRVKSSRITKAYYAQMANQHAKANINGYDLNKLYKNERFKNGV